MILLLLSFWGGFDWYPLEVAGDISVYKTILDSQEGSSIIRRYGGEKNLLKGLIHLNSDIFKGGRKVLLPKKYKIKRTPGYLQLIKRDIEIKNYNRYAALYKEGELKEEWRQLKAESTNKLGISSLEAISYTRLKELFPERIIPTEETGIEEPENESAFIEEIPAKHFFSFLLIEENGREKLIPVILHLSPIEEAIEMFRRMEDEGGER
ncbi:hypothetical protein KAW18_11800 [candidate division WOR-3 bacterium]|nr:hypothetical protein [candidate division WOR-3 bacterium]